MQEQQDIQFTHKKHFLILHLGGARSLSVFNNNIGSGSISPYIVTGGKAGDVGVHDFRYIATGRTKRNRHSDSNEEFVNGSCTTIMRNKIGDQNSHGMLWYIPKAHTGNCSLGNIKLVIKVKSKYYFSHQSQGVPFKSLKLV